MGREKFGGKHRSKGGKGLTSGQMFECDNVKVVSPDVAQGGPFFSDVESHPPLSGSSLVCFLHHPSLSHYCLSVLILITPLHSNQICLITIGGKCTHKKFKC